MTEYSLSQRLILAGAGIWWLGFAILFFLQSNPLQILNIAGFLFLLFVPGYFTLLLLRLEKSEFWGQVGLAVGFSILETILIVLLGNTLLTLIGIDRPLDRNIIFIEISLLSAVLGFGCWLKALPVKIIRKRFLLFENLADTILAFTPIVFVVLSVMGAISLNNGGGNVFTLSMLIGMAVYFVILTHLSGRTDPNVIPVALFFLSLSLLLMTSLRGWTITGHDIQREFRVFELAKGVGIWEMARFQDAYNACLSITILPTVFSNLLKLGNPYVYKLLFQIIFAVVPGLIYLNFQRFVGTSVALLAALYFMIFPTFYGDMPMLNRQEIAFLFLALMLYVLFLPGIALRVRRSLFVCLGIGLILSHYSTTYTVISILAFLIIARPIGEALGRQTRKWGLFANSGLVMLTPRVSVQRLITIPMVTILALASFLWSSVITDTSSHSITRVIKATVTAMQNTIADDARSSDVQYSLFSWRQLDRDAVFKSYQADFVQQVRSNGDAANFYDSSAYDQYPIEVVKNWALPLTALGQWFADRGLDVPAFNYIFRQGTAKVLQMLIIIGMLYLVLRRRLVTVPLDTEFFLLAAGSLLLVFSQVILPVLSVEYGVLRAFQQSLMVLGVFIVFGCVALFGLVREKTAVRGSLAVVIVLFLSWTGVLHQALGGNEAQLHLNNAGLYYDVHYLHESEMAGVKWLGGNIAEEEYQSEVQSDRYVAKKVNKMSQVNPRNDIHPALIRKDSYVYLGYANVHKRQSTVWFLGSLITYTYPVEFLDNTKDKIYDNSNVRIYR